MDKGVVWLLVEIWEFISMMWFVTSKYKGIHMGYDYLVICLSNGELSYNISVNLVFLKLDENALKSE